MRILHTSDWHLGQSFYEHPREDEHQAFLDWLIETLTSEKIDLLIVAGDIYHTATPPSSAENQLYRFIKKTKQTCPDLQIVLIAGNHDSARRVTTARPLLRQFDTQVVGRFDALNPDQVVCRISTPNGEARVVAMPFLRGSDLGYGLASYAEGVENAYREAVSSALENKTSKQPLIVTGHLHARGGCVSADSERNLVIGGEDAIPASVFTEHADYVALGHLHKAQVVAGNESIRYSGTPFAMSFSERNYKHQVVMVEFEGADIKTVKPLYIPSFAELTLLPEGECVPVDELCELLADLPQSAEGIAPYLRLRLSASDTDSSFREKIDKALAGKAVRFCGIERVRAEREESDEIRFDDLSEVESLDPMHLLEQAFAAHKDFAGTEPPERVRKLLNGLIAELEQESGE